MKSDLKPIQDEVLRRVGRNLLLFQHIEGLLKFLLSSHKAGGSPVDFKERLQQRVDTINRTMLGNLANKYGTEVLKDAGVDVAEEESPADWITFSFKISGDTEFVEAMRRDMKFMTEQRNELVHGFLPRWQPESPEKLEEALAYLDDQRDKVRPIQEHLRTMANHIQEGYKKLVESKASEEYQKQSELLLLQASPLVLLLREVATQIHRKDGWSYLAHAGSLANKELPDEVQYI